MAEMHFQFEVFGEKQVGFVFKNLETKISDFRDALENIAQDFYAGEMSTFGAEGAFEGKPAWAPLSEEYAERKRKTWGLQPILIASGKLKRAATSNFAEGSVFRLKKDSLEMGVDVPVGRWNLGLLHQLGTNKMPSREIIRITPPQEKRWIRFLRDFIFQKTKEAQA